METWKTPIPNPLANKDRKQVPGKGPTITQNIQLVPPRLEIQASSSMSVGPVRDSMTWTTVIKRRRNKKKSTSESISARPKPAPAAARSLLAVSVKKRRPPRTAAVTITGVSGEFSYAVALLKAREEIPLLELGIESSKIRRAANGGRIIEIHGPDGARKADDLATRLRSILKEAAIVTRPTIKGELRIIGLDDSVDAEDVRMRVAELGNCLTAEIKVGAIRPLRNGLGAVWVQCPLTAALLVFKIKKMRIGWSVAHVDLLEARPIQCFKCWKFGHLKFNCLEKIDRGNLCFRCGASNHAAKSCTAQPRCIVCCESGLDDSHRFASNLCHFRANNLANHGNIAIPERRSVDIDNVNQGPTD